MKRGRVRLVWWSARESPKVIDRPLARVTAATLGGALKKLAERFPLGLAHARVTAATERAKAQIEVLKVLVARQKRVNRRLQAQREAIERQNESTRRECEAMEREIETLRRGNRKRSDELAAMRYPSTGKVGQC